MRFFYLVLLVFLIAAPIARAQSWVGMMADSTRSFYDIKAAFEEHWQGKEITRGSGWKQFQRWAWFMEPRVFPTGHRIPAGQVYQERQQFLANYGSAVSRSTGWIPLGPSNWTTVSSGYNPGLGRVNVIAEHPTNSSIIYIGAPSGGLWKTIDGGQNWLPLTDDFPTLGVSGIAIDYTNPDVIYISTGDMDGFDTYSIGVMKSIDGGITWQPTGLTHNLSQTIVCRKIAIHPTNPQLLLVATSEGLFKTIDGAASWTQVANGSFRDIEFKSDDPSVVFASTNRFFRSTDTGDSFVLIASSLPPSSEINRMEIAVSPDQPEWVYALGGKSSDASFLGLWRSIDGGLTFQLQADSPNLFGYSETGNDDAGQSWYDMALDVSRTDANIVLVGGINVWRSTNGGSTFNIVSHWVYPSFTGYTHADIHALHYANGNLYCGSDGGVFVSSNNGTTWTDISFGLEISQFYRLGLSAQDPNLVIGGTQDNGSNLFKNGSWTHVLGADGMEAAISPNNSNVMFCTWQFGGIHRTTDGGNNWNFIFDGDGEDGGWVTPYLSLPGNVLLAGYQNVWRSTNNGTSFSQISNFQGSASIRDIAVCKSNTNCIYVSFPGSIHRTINGGTSWQNVTSNLPNNAITDIQVHPTNPDVVWVSLSGFSNGNKVFVTTNGGSSWQNISQNLPNIPCNTIVYQEGSNGGLYVGMDVGIYYTDSTLSNWQAYDQDLPNVIVNELEIHYGAEKIRAATYGRGIWEMDLYSPSSLPPTADFVQFDGVLCVADSLAFFDASTNAAPGWTWYFPGGSPATSTLASPNVLYPASGTYEVSLVVQNVNGTDSIAKLVNVNIEENELVFNVLTDNYPGETSWVIQDASGQIVVSGGGYSSVGTIYEQTICLPYGCYEFTIYDSYGDGICCDFGNGSYSLFDATGDVQISGGQFGSSETQAFCIESENVGLNQQIDDVLIVYPNPAQNILHVRSNSDQSMRVVILDLSGKVVFEQLNVLTNSPIRIADLSAGMYVVQIYSDTWNSSRKLTIVR